MCGRYTLSSDISALQETFPWFAFPPELHPRYNIAPSQSVAVVSNEGNNRVGFYQWGLIPHWAKDASIGNRLINARAETLGHKPAFRSAFKHHRCLILADGFYEWKCNPNGKSKTPMFIHLPSGKPFTFAGLWEIWRGANDMQIRSCTIITTTPNNILSEIHNRMPVILPEEAYPIWLNPQELKAENLSPWLKPYAGEMIAHPVSKMVNNPKIDLPECILPS